MVLLRNSEPPDWVHWVTLNGLLLNQGIFNTSSNNISNIECVSMSLIWIRAVPFCGALIIFPFATSTPSFLSPLSQEMDLQVCHLYHLLKWSRISWIFPVGLPFLHEKRICMWLAWHFRGLQNLFAALAEGSRLVFCFDDCCDVFLTFQGCSHGDKDQLPFYSLWKAKLFLGCVDT